MKGYIMHDEPVIYTICKLYLTDIGECKIVVYDNGDRIPHFHIIHNNELIELDCSICINDAKYYSSSIELSPIQCNELYNVLKSNSSLKTFKSITNYKLIQFAWNLSHDDAEFSKRIPNYKKLKF